MEKRIWKVGDEVSIQRGAYVHGESVDWEEWGEIVEIDTVDNVAWVSDRDGNEIDIALDKLVPHSN